MYIFDGFMACVYYIYTKYLYVFRVRQDANLMSIKTLFDFNVCYFKYVYLNLPPITLFSYFIPKNFLFLTKIDNTLPKRINSFISFKQHTSKYFLL